jgi:hypothetical protein
MRKAEKIFPRGYRRNDTARELRTAPQKRSAHKGGVVIEL